MGIRAALRLVGDAPPSPVPASAPATNPNWQARSSGYVTQGGTAIVVNRDTALSVPAFRQGVHVIAGTVGTFPLQVHRDTERLPTPRFLTNPDPDEPGTVTWARVCTDLVLFPYAWLFVFRRMADGFPRDAMYLPAENVLVEDGRVKWTGMDVPVPGRANPLTNGDDITESVVRFDSPTAPGALRDGARILTTALLVESAVRRFAVMDVPGGYLRQTGGPELTEDEILSLLDGWDAAREQRSTAFLSQTLDYATTALDPKSLQLVEARAANAVDIARLLNLPPMYVNAESGGSLTYSTVAQQGQALANLTLAPYLFAIAGRLSMPDVTPSGQVVSHSLDTFLRADLSTRSTSLATLVGAGILTVDEARAVEGLPPATTAPEPAPDTPPTEGVTP